MLTKNGTNAVINIFLMLSYKFVSVMVATKLALDDVGAHLSPKYAPDIIAPAALETAATALRRMSWIRKLFSKTKK